MTPASSFEIWLARARSVAMWLFRAAVAAVLLVIPIQTLKNISIGDPMRQLHYFSQHPLIGAPTASPIAWSWRTFADGKLQARLTQTVVEAMPMRAFLVRLSNQIRYSVFELGNSPKYIVGADGQLIHRDYITPYCSRNAETAERAGRALASKLQKVQAYFRARKRVFVYLITPSKVAHMPEAFIGTVPCPNSEGDRERLLPEIMSQLKAADIAVVDSASLIHGLKDQYRDVGLFPRGGVHWNALGIAHAAQALVEEINREAGRQIVPEIKWSYVITRNPMGADRDMVELMNLLRPPVDYPVPEVKFQPATPCTESPAPSLKVVIVGNSFSSSLPQVLVPGACLEHLEYYFYLAKRYIGYPLKEIPMTAADTKAIRDADVVILEQNETYFGDGGYIGQFVKEID
jgi:hypothetical protein